MDSHRPSAAPASPGLVVAIGLTLVGAYVSLMLVLFDRTSFDVWGAGLLVPILIGLSLPALWRQAIREADPATFRLLLLALVVKLVGAIARYYVAFSVYGGHADAARYHKAGVALAGPFRHLDFGVVPWVTGTHFIENVTGVVYAITGPSQLAGFVFYSWLGFWGLFLFYRAFTIAVPLGRPRSYAYLLFFLPSLVFWPSSIGKEAWMMFSLGIAAYGVAWIVTHAVWRGLIPCAAGLWMAGMVRPHIAGLVGVAIAAAVISRKSRAELRELAPIVKGASVVAVVIVAAVLIVRTDRFLQHSGIDTGGGVSSTLSGVESRTSQGGGSFVPSILNSPVRAPLAAVTVLFRPFVFETHNLQSLLAAIEGTALLALCLLRFRWVWTALRSVRRQTYVVYCLIFTLAFVVAYSSVANFGLLARERVQLYPLFLVLISIPPAAVERWQSERAREVALSAVSE